MTSRTEAMARPLPGATTHSGDSPARHFRGYSQRLSDVLLGFDWAPVERLTADLLDCWETGRQVFLCGNGGSAGNANHLANDLMYPLSKTKGSGIRAHALSANPAILTCLGNDEGYDSIFAYQLAVQARKGDVLLAFSGSGNSMNILKAIEEARRIGMTSYAVVGFTGGKAKAMADVPIHFQIDDMQIAEDTQTIICHMIVQWLYQRRDAVAARKAHA
ncbi:MAG TPA: SIS domain-containing protein [Hyphomicrobiaceae bacterium]|nr:SIS domain-containing protein [Hyphomicrobiaceae bacterium]